jgi:hypothetical protein
MEISDFINANREELTARIGRVLGHVPKTASCYCPLSGTEHTHAAPDLDDDEIEQWILNDEGLYDWARSEGVEGSEP